jgi:isoleucyl-tRNA synthetase
MFEPVNSKVDFVQLERDVIEWWRQDDTVAKYLRRNDDAEERFSFIDGPITANNPMGVHHAWGRMYKDIFQRLKTMQGFRQRYQNGFDGQGLWIEVEVEKELGFKSKRDIEAFGIDKFVELCKERVRKFSDIQTEQSKRLGYWMNWDDSYHTMSDENNYTIWVFLKKCFDKGWLYEGRDVMPWCPRCGTGLSEHEIVTEGYQEIVHPGLVVRFPIVPPSGPSGPSGQAEGAEESPEPESLLVWTTTPWTLTSNVAAAVNPKMTYLKIRVPISRNGRGNGADDPLVPGRGAAEGGTSGNTEIVYVAKGRLSTVVRTKHEVLGELPGEEFVDLAYSGPFDELEAQEDVTHRVIAWDEVSEDEGTGIVHIAPGAGKEDFALSKDLGLPAIAPLDEFGDFVEGFDWLTGMNVYDVSEPIYKSLQEKGIFYRLDPYSHRYPVCWRCGSELVFRLVDEWFISMDELRHKIAEVTKKIKWVPGFGLQRELDWLQNMDDWMVSKKRYWGLALPIYKCVCGHFEVVGSETELKERAVEGWSDFDGHSPHRPWIDAVKIACSACGETVSRIRDVGNPWLDAGIVPYSTLKYRSDRNYWNDWFPADWISESFPGQFRNWFYSLLTMSTVMEDTEPFKAVFSYALMRDEKGAEMHKSKGNAIWFEEAADKMGVDTMRWLYTRHNPAVNLNFGYGVADEVRRQLLIPLWNVYSFFVTYANIDGYEPGGVEPLVATRSELDRWILSELNQLVAEVTGALEGYEPDKAAHLVESFIAYLSNWYVRRSRRRFWKAGVLGEGSDDADKLSAYATLYECLTTIVKLVAPIMPFVTDAIHRNLASPGANGSATSVHLADYPVADESLIDRRLSDATRLAMTLSSLGRAARSKAGIKVRQPLAAVLVSLRSSGERELLSDIAAQVRDELNVKLVAPTDDQTGVMSMTVLPNLPILGKKYGAAVRDIRQGLSEMDPFEVHAVVSAGGKLSVAGHELEPDEVLITAGDREGYSVASEGGYTVAVDTSLTEELLSEGTAREVVHRIQNMRRDAGFDIADHITTYYFADQGLAEVMSAYADYVRSETLTNELVSGVAPEGAHVETMPINDQELTVGLVRVQ